MYYNIHYKQNAKNSFVRSTVGRSVDCFFCRQPRSRCLHRLAASKSHRESEKSLGRHWIVAASQGAGPMLSEREVFSKSANVTRQGTEELKLEAE